MEKYVNNIIEILCSHYDYRIIEISNHLGLVSPWAIVKKTYDGLKVSVFTGIEEMKIIDKEQLKNECIASLSCDNILINYILILDNAKAYDLYNQNNFLLGFDRENVIIISNEHNKIIYSNNSDNINEELERILLYFDDNKHNKKRYPNIPIITYAIIALNVIVFLLTAYLSRSIINSDARVLIFLGANNGKLVFGGEYYRLFAAMFLHGGIIHLLLNMYALYSLGPLIENIYGKIKFIVIYIVSGIASSLLSCVFSKGISVGASGAIFGLFGSALIFALKNKDRIGKDFLKNIASVIVVNLIIGFSIPNIDNFGHMGGLVGGIITTIIVGRK